MEPLAFTDKLVEPTDDLIFAVIGSGKIIWEKLMDGIRHRIPGASGEWRYYNDGKSWLFKMVLKKKTLFWIGVHENSFRVTFYFGEKAEPVIENSGISPDLIQQYKTGQRFGKIRAISMEMLTSADLDNALNLAEIKVKV